MASTATQSSGVTSVSYSFVLKWKLKAKELKQLLSSSAAVLRSDQYQFKTSKDLLFYLEIEYYSRLEITIKGSNTWSFDLPYAFLVCKEKVFRIMVPKQLEFLNYFTKSSAPDDEDVTVQCVVIACSVHPAEPAEEDKFSLQEGQNTVYFEDIPDTILPSDYTNKTVFDFIRRGDLPELDVAMAAEIIGQTKYHKCEVLKIICVEYLMNNITSQNLRQILRAAINYDLPLLERACTNKLVDGSIKTK